MTPPAGDGLPADSAGVPWSGRSLQPSGFEGDTGDADPRLAAALGARARGTNSVEDVVEALAASRLLVPVVATLGDAATSPGTGLPAEKSAEMAVVTLRGTDGRVALPVFSSTSALAAWNADARPVPVDARRAALAAVQDGAELLVLDVAGPVTVAVPRPAVWALAQGRRWTPSPRDPEVLAAVTAAAAAEPDVRAASCEPGARAELAVVLAVRPGLDRTALDVLTQAVGRRLASDATVAERVDSVEMRITAG